MYIEIQGPLDTFLYIKHLVGKKSKKMVQSNIGSHGQVNYQMIANFYTKK